MDRKYLSRKNLVNTTQVSQSLDSKKREIKKGNLFAFMILYLVFIMLSSIYLGVGFHEINTELAAYCAVSLFSIVQTIMLFSFLAFKLNKMGGQT